MPNYEYENVDTGERFTRLSTWDDSQKFLEENPNLKRIIGAPKIVGGVGGVLSKTDDGWNDTLKRIKSGAGKNNTINTKN